jgi:hypothetical protein
MKCQAMIEDYAQGQHFTMQRLTIPKTRQCMRNAKFKLGSLCFCMIHLKLAREGLIDEAGIVAPRQSIRDVRDYPKKFPNGLYQWADNLKSEAIK